MAVLTPGGGPAAFELHMSPAIDVNAFTKAALAALILLAGAGVALAQDAPPVPETFTATTANMDPSGAGLRINVLDWPTEADREAVIDVLASPEAGADGDTDFDALLDLPTRGYVWPDGSALGYSIKYAHRAETADGGEHLTFVTGRRLGEFGREPWAPEGTPDAALRPFSVIELRLDANGDGAGTLSPAADVAFDEVNQTVTLVDYDAAPTLLTAVRRQPPPYWAR